MKIEALFYNHFCVIETDTSTDQVVPALNRDAKYSLQPLAVVTKTQSAFAAPFEKPGKVSTEKVATHYPITRPLLPSTNQVSQESFHSNSSLKTAPPVMQSSGWHQQAQSASDQFSMFSGRLNLSESLMVPHLSTGGNSSLRPEELHVAYTRLAARYFEESDKQQQQQQISESIKREHPSFITQSSVKRLELDANFVNYKPRIVLPVGPTLRRPDKERTCATAPEAKRRKINRRRNPVRFLQPSAASRHLTANEVNTFFNIILVLSYSERCLCIRNTGYIPRKYKEKITLWCFCKSAAESKAKEK